MSSEDFSVTESDGLYGAGGGIVAIECIEMHGGGPVVDVDFVRGGGVEEITVDDEAGDWIWEGRRGFINGGDTKVRDGEV